MAFKSGLPLNIISTHRIYISIFNIENFLYSNNLTLILSQKRQTLCMRKHYNSNKKKIFIGIYYLKMVAVYGGRRESNHVKLKNSRIIQLVITLCSSIRYRIVSASFHVSRMKYYTRFMAIVLLVRALECSCKYVFEMNY